MVDDRKAESQRPSQPNSEGTVRFRFGPAFVGWLMMNILSLVMLAVFSDSKNCMVYTMTIGTLIVFLVVGITLGYWISRLPTAEIVVILVLGFIGPFVKMSKGTIFEYGWASLFVSVALSALASFAGAYVGVLLRKKKSPTNASR